MAAEPDALESVLHYLNCAPSGLHPLVNTSGVASHELSFAVRDGQFHFANAVEEHALAQAQSLAVPSGLRIGQNRSA